MPDEIIDPSNGLLLVALQAGVGQIATLDPTIHAVPFEKDSFRWNSPTKSEASNEATGSSVAAAPLIIGQASTVSFRSRIKGAGAGTVYTSMVKPPLHAVLSACGMRGQFTSAIAAAALTAGSTTSATLGTGFAGTAQQYRGMPLILSVGPGAGAVPLITNYTSGKVATLSDTLPALDNTTLAAIPANWTYAGTSPADATARATDRPYATVGYYEGGVLYVWYDVRGIFDQDGDSSKPGYASVTFTGIFQGKTDAAVPANAVVANHSAPTLLQGAAVSPAIVAARKAIPVSKWSVETGGQVESPDDPNTPQGFRGGELSDRTPMFKADPLSTLVATRDALAEIAAFANYPIAMRFGTVAGNRWAQLHAVAQPVDVDQNQMRGKLRAEQISYQALGAGKDAYSRDGDRIICFF